MKTRSVAALQLDESGGLCQYISPDDQLASRDFSGRRALWNLSFFPSVILAAEFQALYGKTLASALRTPPSLHAFFDMDTAALKASDAMSFPWICAPLHDLTRKLQKLSRADVQTCLDNLPSPLRSYSRCVLIERLAMLLLTISGFG